MAVSLSQTNTQTGFSSVGMITVLSGEGGRLAQLTGVHTPWIYGCSLTHTYHATDTLLVRRMSLSRTHTYTCVGVSRGNDIVCSHQIVVTYTFLH